MSGWRIPREKNKRPSARTASGPAVRRLLSHMDKSLHFLLVCSSPCTPILYSSLPFFWTLMSPLSERKVSYVKTHILESFFFVHINPFPYLSSFGLHWPFTRAQRETYFPHCPLLAKPYFPNLKGEWGVSGNKGRHTPTIPFVTFPCWSCTVHESFCTLSVTIHIHSLSFSLYITYHAFKELFYSIFTLPTLLLFFSFILIQNSTIYLITSS